MNGPRALFIALLCLLASAAGAHTRSESYSVWRESGKLLRGTVTIPAREATRIPDQPGAQQLLGDRFAQHLKSRVRVASAQGDCRQDEPLVLAAAPGFIRVELSFYCSEQSPQQIHYRGLFDIAPSHVHFARLLKGSETQAEKLFTDNASTWRLPKPGVGRAHSLKEFFMLGMRHIAGGLDHIAFLLGLLLIAGSWRRCIIAVTGFTLGHSLSLALAVLGLVRADARMVEAFIGFTVALVAAEFFLNDRRLLKSVTTALIILALMVAGAAGLLDLLSLRGFIGYLGIAVLGVCYLQATARSNQTQPNGVFLLLAAAGLFGAIHGFGFAGFLMDTGLLGNGLFEPLLGFNLGVEAGQLLLVAIALLAGRFLTRVAPVLNPQLLAAGLCGLGIYWFIGRSLAAA